MAGRRSTQDARTIAHTMVRMQSNTRQAAQLSIAATSVIARRFALGHAAMTDPATADHEEFMRMGSEKTTAAMAAAGIAARRSPAIAMSAVRFGFAELAAAWASAARVATAPSPAAMAQAQLHYMTEAVGRAFSL